MVTSTVKAAALSAATATAIGLGVLGAAPAQATEWGVNGTFATSSNGEWAKVSERYQKEPSVRSTWTITTVCSTPVDCAGTVNSDAGWSAPIYTNNGIWYVKRVVPNWKYCADEWTGEDQTTGPSGSCGRNQWPAVRMPFYMKKI